jgi:hypothetical protein
LPKGSDVRQDIVLFEESIDAGLACTDLLQEQCAGYHAAGSALFELSKYLAGSACKQLLDANPSIPVSIFRNE